MFATLQSGYRSSWRGPTRGFCTAFIGLMQAVLITAALTAPSHADPFQIARHGHPDRHIQRNLKFDVAESGPKFVFDEAPLLNSGPNAGFPAYGNPFVTQGYIYPHGTLTDSNGVNAEDGSPEFPELVIGIWTCRGYFIGNGADTVSGPWVITTQHYEFYDQAGYSPDKYSTRRNLVTDGYELVDKNVPGLRAVTGGTGPYRFSRGQAEQILLGHNQSEGVNLRFKVRVR